MVSEEQKGRQPEKRKTATRVTSYSETDTRNKLNAFIEILESIRANKAA